MVQFSRWCIVYLHHIHQHLNYRWGPAELTVIRIHGLRVSYLFRFSYKSHIFTVASLFCHLSAVMKTGVRYVVLEISISQHEWIGEELMTHNNGLKQRQIKVNLTGFPPHHFQWHDNMQNIASFIHHYTIYFVSDQFTCQTLTIVLLLKP